MHTRALLRVLQGITDRQFAAGEQAKARRQRLQPSRCNPEIPATCSATTLSTHTCGQSSAVRPALPLFLLSSAPGNVRPTRLRRHPDSGGRPSQTSLVLRMKPLARLATATRAVQALDHHVGSAARTRQSHLRAVLLGSPSSPGSMQGPPLMVVRARLQTEPHRQRSQDRRARAMPRLPDDGLRGDPRVNQNLSDLRGLGAPDALGVAAGDLRAPWAGRSMRDDHRSASGSTT